MTNHTSHLDELGPVRGVEVERNRGAEDGGSAASISRRSIRSAGVAIMADDRLTRCERPGTMVTFINPSPAERDAIQLQFMALKAQKHAVIADEVQHGDSATELRIHHYASCLRCIGAR